MGKFKNSSEVVSRFIDIIKGEEKLQLIKDIILSDNVPSLIYTNYGTAVVKKAVSHLNFQQKKSVQTILVNKLVSFNNNGQENNIVLCYVKIIEMLA
jgi:hypothetical protein